MHILLSNLQVHYKLEFNSSQQKLENKSSLLYTIIKYDIGGAL